MATWYFIFCWNCWSMATTFCDFFALFYSISSHDDIIFRANFPDDDIVFCDIRFKTQLCASYFLTSESHEGGECCAPFSYKNLAEHTLQPFSANFGLTLKIAFWEQHATRNRTFRKWNADIFGVWVHQFGASYTQDFAGDIHFWRIFHLRCHSML